MSEISDTAVLVKLGGEGSYYLLKGSVKATMFLYQTIKKLNHAKILGKGEVENFEKFVKATEGKYKIINIPTENPEDIAKMKEDFAKLGISYSVLPDLNVGDGQIQVAYSIQDTEKVQSWYRSFCLDRMQGGEKSYNDLMNLTGGQVSIINIPWPDADMPADDIPKNFERFKEDLQSARPQYPHGVVPDLNPNDGRIQIIVPSYDAEDLKSWYADYAGTPAGDIQIETIDDYLKTGSLDEYTYADGAGKEIKEKLQPTAKQQEPVRMPMGGTHKPPLEDDPEAPEETGIGETLGVLDSDVSVSSFRLPDIEPEKSPDAGETPTKGRAEKERQTESRTRRPTREESLGRLKGDLDRLHINYTILPDLNVGDGYVQVAYATADAPKLRAWYEAYQNDMLSAGQPMGDMKEMTLDEYLNTGTADPSQPFPSGRASEEDASRTAPDIKADTGRKTKPATEYEQTKARPGMVELSINESLVKSAVPDGPGGFVSRIPGGGEFFAVKPDLLYRTDGGQTFGILADKDTEIQILDTNGNYIRSGKLEDIAKRYDTIRESMDTAPKEILYKKSEDPGSNLREAPRGPYAAQNPHQEAAEYKSAKSSNRFSNFDQRAYPSGFYENLERASMQRSPFEKAVNGFENAAPGTSVVAEEKINNATREGKIAIENLVGVERQKNGDILFVAQMPGSEDYFSGIADAAVRKGNGSFENIMIDSNKEVTLVSKEGEFLKTVKVNEIIKDTAITKDVSAPAKEAAKKVMSAPKL